MGGSFYRYYVVRNGEGSGGVVKDRQHLDGRREGIVALCDLIADAHRIASLLNAAK